MAKAYVLPFCLYLLGTGLISLWPDDYPLGYAGVVLAVGLITGWLLRGRNIIVPHAKIGLAILVGLVGIVLWIGLSELRLEERLARFLPEMLRPAPRTGYDPGEHLREPWAYWGFVGVRLLGLVLLVPVAEEIFWRGFLARWLKSPHWEEVALGDFTPASFLIVVLLFALAHPEWLAAGCYCALLNGLLIWKRDLWNCIVAHAVSNLALAVYILQTESWWLW